jgi:hypothetical protein
MRKPQLPGDGSASHIAKITVNLYPLDPLNLKSNPDQGRADFGGQALVDMSLVNPVANFAGVRAQAGMEAASPQNQRLLRVKDAIDEILAQVKFAPELPEELNFLLKVLRLLLRPGHPGPQVIQALVYGSFQQGRVSWIPAAKH